MYQMSVEELKMVVGDMYLQINALNKEIEFLRASLNKQVEDQKSAQDNKKPTDFLKELDKA